MHSRSVTLLGVTILSTFLVCPGGVLAGGGGGGGGSDPSEGFSMTVGGRTTSVSDVSKNPDGTYSGTFSSSDGNWSGLTGQPSMYSQTLGGWVTNPPTYDGGTNTWGSSEAAPCTGDCDGGGGNVTVSQSCSGTSASVQINNNNTTSGSGTLYLNGSNYGSINGPGSKTVTLPSSTNYTGRIDATVSYWDTGNPSWPHWEETQQSFHFSFKTINCYPAPTVSLYVKNQSLVEGTWTQSNISIDPGHQIALYWSSSNASSCSGVNFSTGGAVTGTQTSVGEPAAGSGNTYRVDCSGSGGSAYDILTVNTRPYKLPTATLQVRNITTGGGWVNDSITIEPGQEVEFTWSSTETTSCVGSGFSTGADEPTSGTQSSVDEPSAGSTGNYILGCEGSGGTAGDAVAVTVNPYPTPSVTLEIDVNGSGVYENVSERVIDPGDEISLRWSSTNAVSCSANTTPIGGGFSADGATSGTDDDIVEPDTADGRTYRIVCTNEGNETASDQILVAPSEQVALTATPRYVRSGEDVTLSWNVGANDPASCDITGPNYSSGQLSGTVGSTDVAIAGESTFTLSCGDETDSETVRILPRIQET